MLRVFRHYLPARRALLVLSEFVILALALAIGLSAHLLNPSTAVLEQLVRQGMDLETAWARSLISAAILAALSQVALAFNELYEFRISSSRYDRASRFVTSSAAAMGLAFATVLLTRLWHLEHVLDFPGLTTSQLVQSLVMTMLVTFTLLYFWRSLFHFTLRRFNFNQRVLILGSGEGAQSLAAQMLAHTESGYEAVAILGEDGLLAQRVAASSEVTMARPERRAEGRRETARAREGAQTAAEAVTSTAVWAKASIATAEPQLPRDRQGPKVLQLAPGQRLFELVEEMGIDLVCVALEDRRRHLPTEELLRCRLAGIIVKEREALYEDITGKIAVEALRPSYLIFNDGFGRSMRGDLAKRAFDVVLASIMMVLAIPLMLLSALAVRLDSKGSVLFAQERVGLNGKPFTLLKFRSMRSDAESKSGPVWAQKDDPRITRVGRFLRKTRLDELPQLINVLAGDMSLIGPRPERPVFVSDLTEQIPYYNQRHIVKPGLTGWAQINYPYGNTVADAMQKLQYDLFYIKNKSVLFDLSILFTTVKTVILRRGT